MAHVFLSYVHAEKTQAQRLANRLTEAGFDVWWDEELVAGQDFNEVIQKIIEATPAAIVLWSRAAVKSDWVKAEANIARERRSAIPVMIDDVPVTALPIPFQQYHMIRLADWQGGIDDRNFQQVLKAVVEMTGRPAISPSATAPQPGHGTRVSDEDQALWDDVSKSNEAADYREYISKIGPNGPFVRMAEVRMARATRRAQRLRLLAGGAVAALVAVFLSVVLMRGLSPQPVPLPASSSAASESSVAIQDFSSASQPSVEAPAVSSDESLSFPVSETDSSVSLLSPDLLFSSSPPADSSQSDDVASISSEPGPVFDDTSSSDLFASSSEDISASTSTAGPDADPRCGSEKLVTSLGGEASVCMDLSVWDTRTAENPGSVIFGTDADTFQMTVGTLTMSQDDQRDFLQKTFKEDPTTKGMVTVSEPSAVTIDGRDWTKWHVHRQRADDTEYTVVYFYSDDHGYIFLMDWNYADRDSPGFAITPIVNSLKFGSGR